MDSFVQAALDGWTVVVFTYRCPCKHDGESRACLSLFGWIVSRSPPSGLISQLKTVEVACVLPGVFMEGGRGGTFVPPTCYHGNHR